MPSERHRASPADARASASSERLATVAALLVEEARDRCRRHALAPLLASDAPTLDVRFSLSTSPTVRDVSDVVAELDRGLEEALRAQVAYRTLFRPGRAFCLRCQSAECEHGVPGSSREVFAGYGATGLPRFQELGAWFLERKDPRVDLLFREDRPVLASVTDGHALTSEFLPAFRDRERGFFLHGQVCAGWYRVPDGRGGHELLAITVQVLSSRSARGRRSFGLNLIGVGPQGESLEDVRAHLDESPWANPIRWARGVLDAIEKAAGRSGRTPERVLRERIERMLRELGRRLEHGERARGRRTQHGEERHRGGERPTRKAFADVARARDEALLVDARRGTIVVVGDRGRTHIFAPSGKLVTSVQYTPQVIERRVERGVWRPATAAEAGTFRDGVAAAEEASRRLEEGGRAAPPPERAPR